MRAALRMAWREMRRARGRSALVIAMIALPVACLAFVAVASDTFTLTTAEEMERHLGSADARVSWVSRKPIHQSPKGDTYWSDEQTEKPDHTTQELLAQLPAGARIVPEVRGIATVRTANGLGQINAVRTDIADPVFVKRVVLLKGVAPAEPGQVALSAQAADWLGLAPGDKLRLTDPDRTFTVTGIVEFPGDLLRTAVFPVGTPIDLDSGLGTEWLVASPVPLRWEAIKDLNEKGIFATSREVILHPPDGIQFDGNRFEPDADELAFGAVIGVLLALEVVLLAGPAFAVGTRRRARDLALVAAAGGEPKQLRRIILADGLILGIAGALTGLILGVGAFAAGRDLVEMAVQGRGGAWRFAPLTLLGLGVLAVGTGLLAALIPAFVAAKQDVVKVLSGRRGVVRSRKRWIAVGLVTGAVGMLTTVAGVIGVEQDLILAGLVLLELGLVVLTPAFIGLVARVGKWLPLTARLALRDTARNRGAAAPAISAVMAAVAGAVAVGVFAWGTEKQYLDQYSMELPLGHTSIEQIEHYPAPKDVPEMDWARAEEIMREVIPGAAVRRISTADVWAIVPPERLCPFMNGDLTEEQHRAARNDPRCRGEGTHFSYHQMDINTVVDDGSGLDVLSSGASLTEARKVLADGGVVVTDPLYLKDGKVTLTVDKGRTTFSFPGYVLDTGHRGVAAVISPGALKVFGLRAQVKAIIAAPAAPPTEAQTERLSLLVADLGGDIFTYTETGPRSGRDDIAIILAAAAALIALGAAFIATGLAAADARADLATLAAVGAAPGVRRRMSMGSAGVISGLGALLGTGTGLAIAAAMIFATNTYADMTAWPVPAPVPFLVPWDTIAVVIAVPLLAMAGAFLFTRARLPIERRI